MVPVAGIVTYHGSPVSGASVAFAPADDNADSRSASSLTDASGRFHLTSITPGDGAKPGEYVVVISKTEMTNPPPSNGTPAELQDYYNAVNAKKIPAPTTKDLLPKKYREAATTNLKATVASGRNPDFSFDLAD